MMLHADESQETTAAVWGIAHAAHIHAAVALVEVANSWERQFGLGLISESYYQQAEDEYGAALRCLDRREECLRRARGRR